MTDGYTMKDGEINYTEAIYTDLLKVNGATAAEGDMFTIGGAKLTASDISTVSVRVFDTSINNPIDIRLNIDNQLYTPTKIVNDTASNLIKTYDAANAASDVSISLATTDTLFRVIGIENAGTEDAATVYTDYNENRNERERR